MVSFFLECTGMLEEKRGKGEEQRYFIPTVCGVKGHVCQLCRLVLAQILCQQVLIREDACP